MGMVSGIALATTLLYGSMSAELGYRVTDYVAGQNGAFINGMRVVYITAAMICLIGAGLTFFRLLGKKSKVIDQAVMSQKDINAGPE
jgi:hypothetical protein